MPGPKHHGQLLVWFDPNQLQERPFSLKGLLVEKLDSAHINHDGTSSQMSFFGQIDKKVPNLLLAELIGRTLEMPGKVSYALQVSLLCARQ